MAVKDVAADINVVESILRGTHKTAQTGTAADLQGYNGAAVYFVVSTVTDGTHTPSVEHNDTSSSGDSGWAAVSSSELTGSLSAFSNATSQKVSYIGSKRFVRAKVASSGTTGAVYQAVVVRGAPSQSPADA